MLPISLVKDLIKGLSLNFLGLRVVHHFGAHRVRLDKKIISAQTRPLQRIYRIIIVLLIWFGLHGVKVSRVIDVFRAISNLYLIVELVLHHVVKGHVFVYF